jgi:hypothetical protein
MLREPPVMGDLWRACTPDRGMVEAIVRRRAEGSTMERTTSTEVVPLEDGYHRVSTPASGVIGFVREQDGRYEVLRGRVRQATRSEGAYSTMNVALIALTHA